MNMPPEETAEMPDAREVFKAMKTLMDQWTMFYRMQGGAISAEDANCFRAIGAILDTKINRPPQNVN